MISPISMAHLAHKYGGVIMSPDLQIESVSIDSRTIRAGQIFLALRGEQFDGHQYLRGAYEKGAAALVSEEVFTGSLTQWIVKDGLKALGYIAHENRLQFDGKLIALTGSNGKTTVKEMIALVLGLSGKVLATKGNFNNHIGLPLTLMALEAGHEYAVTEMGASAVGEIDYLTHIAEPDVALVNNVGDAHVEGFGSLENIEIGKGEIYSGLRAGGTAVINLDSRGAARYIKAVDGNALKALTFSSEKTEANVFASGVRLQEFSAEFILNYRGDQSTELSPEEAPNSIPIQLQVPGIHNIRNALAAASCCLAVGMSLEQIQKGLAQFSGVSGRLQRHLHSSGAMIIDDSYNASPVSVKSAIDTLSAMQGKTILVLGAMAELGADSDRLHFEVGEYAGKSGLRQMITVGALAANAAQGFMSNSDQVHQTALALDTKQEAVSALLKTLASDASDVKILIKGSRSSRMEDVLNSIKIKGE